MVLSIRCVHAGLMMGLALGLPFANARGEHYLIAPGGTGDHPTIQDAIDAAEPGTIIELADGIFRGDGNRDVDFRGKAITIRSVSGNPDACIVDCQGSDLSPHRGFIFQTAEGAASVLQALTIRNGVAYEGGGVLCRGASPTFRNCVFTEDRVNWMGGGVYCIAGSNPHFHHCRFIRNASTGAAGALGTVSSFPTLVGCTFLGNHADRRGGAVHSIRNYSKESWTVPPELEEDRFPRRITSFTRYVDCTFSGNTSGLAGGAVSLLYCSPRFENTVFAHNHQDATYPNTIHGGALAHNTFSYPLLENCNLYGNSGGDWIGYIEEQFGIRGNRSVDPARGGGSAAAPVPSGKELAVRERLRAARNRLIALKNRGWLCEIQGDYAAAETLFRELLATHQRLLGDAHPRVAESLENVAYVLWERGNAAESEVYYRQALGIRRCMHGASHETSLRCLTDLARVVADSEDLDTAEALLREALALLRSGLGEEHIQTAECLSDLGMLSLAKGDPTEAERFLRRALEIRAKTYHDDHTLIAWDRHHLATALQAEHQYRDAEQLFRRALGPRRIRFGDDHPIVARTLSCIADCILGWGLATGETTRHAQADSLYARAASIFERARLDVGRDFSRAEFLDSPYTRLAATRWVLERTDDVWPALERAHGRALADMLLASDGRSLDPREASRADSLLDLLGQCERRLPVLEEAARSDTTGEATALLAESRILHQEVKVAWAAFQENMAAKYPLAEGQTLPLESVQRTLPETTAIIGWLHHEVDQQVFASAGYVIRSSGPVAWIGLETEDAAGRACIREFREGLVVPPTTTDSDQQLARLRLDGEALWRYWVAPLTRFLEGIDHLVVIPSGPMLGIPLESLLDDAGDYLGTQYAISYSPSATVYAWLQEEKTNRARPPSRETLLVGDPPFTPQHLAAMRAKTDDSELQEEPSPSFTSNYMRSALSGNEESLARLPRLRWTRTEVTRIEPLVPEATSLLGEAASEKELMRMARSGGLRRFGIIHLATHALIDDRRPERSALVLSRAELPDPLEAASQSERIFDGLLTAAEIVREIDLDADLVTLSACQTGLGRETPGEGYVGLAQAFLRAGARSLLVSLWRVEDEATALLMTRFYENLAGSRGEPMSKARALQEAKHWLRSQAQPSFPHPCSWAGFILIGDPE